MLIIGSRPLGAWFSGPVMGPLTRETIEAGSVHDRIVLSALILLALYVLYKRKVEWSPILKDNSGLVFLIIFSGLSIIWSGFPFLSTKRWIRLWGIIPVAIVILSELNPRQALESILRRCTYVLIPLSIVLIKYYPHFGRSYSPWSGRETWIGVTTTKNELGQLCMFSIFFIFWEYLRKWRDKRFLRTGFVKYADGLVLAIAAFMLLGLGTTSGSATSILTLIVGIVSLLLMFRKKIGAKRMASLLICATAFTWVLFSFGGSIVEKATKALGRDPTFTGRTELWQILLEEGARHPLLGAGFGGYFGTPGNYYQEVTGTVSGHNGLLSVYVQLGIAGIILVVAFHLGFFRRFLRELDSAFSWGVFGICFLVLSLLENISESIFLYSTSYIWSITVLLSIVFSLPYLNIGRNENNA
ncbi:MAG: O-antigen ligase family protein [Planctomycetes bacterium]|nr:O-antigen ligase family protein [Planctomycetota bacterium]